PPPTPAVSVSPLPALPLPTPTPSLLPTPSALPAPVAPLPPAVVPGPTGSLPAARDSAGTTAAPIDAAPPAHPVYQPSPDEQASLPNEPERLAYEQQQLDVASDFASFDATLGGIAIGAGGGTGRFGWPVVVPAGRKAPITQRF